MLHRPRCTVWTVHWLSLFSCHSCPSPLAELTATKVVSCFPASPAPVAQRKSKEEAPQCGYRLSRDRKTITTQSSTLPSPTICPAISGWINRLFCFHHSFLFLFWVLVFPSTLQLGLVVSHFFLTFSIAFAVQRAKSMMEGGYVWTRG